MKKDIEWLKKKFDEVVEFRKQSNPSSSWGMGSNAVLKYIKEDFKNLINQLDEPEVLSQEWIDENKVARINNLRKMTMSDVVPAEDLQNLLVPKRELPVIPKYVAEYLEFAKSDVSLMRVLELRYELPKWEREYDWISENSETFARAWLDGYEVEEEQKYYVSSRESAGFWFLSKNNDDEVVIGTNKDYYDRRWENIKLTEQEIKDFDPRYWAFRNPVDE